MTRKEAVELIRLTSGHLYEAAKVMKQLGESFQALAAGLRGLADEFEKGFDDE